MKVQNCSIEYLSQLQLVYNSYQNLAEGRFSSLSIIDEKSLENSCPVFNYYSPPTYLLLGLMNFIIRNIVYTYIFGIWLFSLIAVVGTYYLTKKISHSKKVALLLAFVYVSYPYFVTNILSRHAYSEYLALCMVPIVLFLTIKLIEQTRKLNSKGGLLRYLLFSSIWVIITSIFLLIHNITSLFIFVITAPCLLVYVFRQIKPKIKHLLFLIPPILFVLLNISFFVKVLLETKDLLLISTSYESFLQEYFKLNTLYSLFSPIPYSPPYALSTNELFFQFGLPAVFLGMLFFRLKNIHLYLIFVGLICLILSPLFWLKIPKIFHTVQFSYRLIGYVPIILIFAARRIPKKYFLIAILVSILSATIFLYRNVSFQKWNNFELNQSPTVNCWNYFISNPALPNINNAGKLSEKSIYPDPLKMETKSNQDKKTYESELVNFPDKTTALNFYIPSSSEDKDKWNFSLELYDSQGKKTSERQVVINIQDHLFFGQCINGVSQAKILAEPLEKDLAAPQIFQLEENLQTFTYINPNEELIFPVECGYYFGSNKKNIVINLDNSTEETVILPMFYSPYNNITDADGNQINATGGFSIAQAKAYTVVKKPKNVKEIHIQIMQNNRFRLVSLISFFSTCFIFLISLSIYFIQRYKNGKTHLPSKI